ncbi:hypothetical protein A2W67_03795 [Candidatus Nomurabacteria bacterium RIFCSPLOWO2_02_40_28]|uniref:DUF8128 domain-containing protein n=2 Tax=Candidatus Nomuraibacteriota TaxID=1752729 RepID=A0A837HRZ4_9BACT|nr:MAG: hypothetical protein UT27_C0004G0005 [Candidatus Nomurabacteria bacterium GW2011_GWD2_39_12]KKR20867.1 MAG: hypothetical protein UT51_C0001G0005 [Candidatus Nomurabacteria bacterium GW2011_GWC2_39_41]KKR36391.1 MAG: hypothetical protein UT70_C0014G0005 [Candidatus Nomurabacteria bacterium GW2011_GWE2_40_10]KKR38816.1 MAG: hypothetical protein UT73_C0001G0004 [Candidatus Nomurabacteria bacterium GW2011_GWB1_40_11]KKR40014.1 MAG: hypothetical protein UT74_C0003G0005 [Parcubacteria group b
MVDSLIYSLYKLFIGLLPLFGVIILGRIAWLVWIHYIQQDFISGIDFVLLEIIPPRDVLRSPKAMELFLSNALYHWSMKGGKEEYWQGAVWFWFSLEIASIDGQVHFYIRTPTRIRGLIETQMYAQYPQSQVKEAEDYTLAVPEISPDSAWNGWGCEFRLTRPEAYPIKTYVDFGLDKDPDEELKVDPISSVVEFFGSLQKGEQAWVQIVVTPTKKTWHTKGTWFGRHDWVQESKQVIIDLVKPYGRINPDPFHKQDQSRAQREFRTPTFLDNAVKAMSAKTAKLGFETGIRVMYVAKKEIHKPGTRTNASRDIRLMFRQYARPDCNELYRFNSAQGDFYSGYFPASKETVMMLANRMLHEYRERSFFHLPLRHHIFSQHYWAWPFPGIIGFDGLINAYAHHKTFVLNTEELATLWHFPGQILKVPTLTRIESKEASPPPNLPI